MAARTCTRTRERWMPERANLLTAISSCNEKLSNYQVIFFDMSLIIPSDGPENRLRVCRRKFQCRERPFARQKSLSGRFPSPSGVNEKRPGREGRRAGAAESPEAHQHFIRFRCDAWRSERACTAISKRCPEVSPPAWRLLFDLRFTNRFLLHTFLLIRKMVAADGPPTTQWLNHKSMDWFCCLQSKMSFILDRCKERVKERF